MIKYKHSICLFLTFIILVLINTHSLASTFSIETVDGPKYAASYTPESIAVDTSGNPHIVYGSDHLYYAYYDGSTWQFETIDASPCVGACASIALDTSDKVHISYYDGGNNSLKYATNTSGSWITETVDSGGGYGCGWDVHSSIALDSLRNAHITYYLYYNRSRGNLKYATNASGKWIIKTIGKKGKKAKYEDTGRYSSIAIDKLDKVHISDSGRIYDKHNKKTTYYLMYATNTSGSWTRETIDEITSSGGTSIAIDKSNSIHISYFDGSFFAGGDIKYATNSSGSWTISTIEREAASSDTPSIAIDASGSAHVSYTNGDFWSATYNLKYATNVTGTWLTTTVDAGGNSSIALDTGGKAHISYGHNGLKYVTNVSGLWNVTEIDNNSGSVGFYNSIGIDSSNKAHISYLDTTNDNLKYATNTSGSWVISTVDNSGWVNGESDLALDTSGKVHISYLERTDNITGTENNLKYVTNASGSWVTTIIDDSNHAGGRTSIAVDSSGKVHISYWDWSNDDLKYATNVSGKWTITTIDSGGVGENPSVAVDTLGNVHISYYDYSNGDLKYATNVSGKWVTQTVDSLKGSGQTGDNSSIAIDASGNAHISYHEILNSRLKYATNTSGKWIKETVGEQHEECNSLALDSSGKAHISYYFNYNLWYATNISGKWITSVVDSDKGGGIYNSIALDSFGNEHISYWDWSNHDLKYATTAVSYTLENNDNTINYSK